MLSVLLIPIMGYSQDNMETDNQDMMDNEMEEELEEEINEFENRMESLYERHENYIGEIVSYQSLFYNGRLYNERIEKKKALILDNRINTITISEYKWADDFEDDEWYKNTTEYYNETGNITKIRYKQRNNRGRITETSEDFMYKFKTNRTGNIIKKIITQNDTFYEQKQIGIDSLCRIHEIKEPYDDRLVDTYFFDYDKKLTRSVTLGGKHEYYYEYEYDKFNNLSKFISRNKEHQIISTEKYKKNEWGQVIKKKVLDYNFKPILKSVYKYNSNGYLISEQRLWIKGQTKLKGTIKYKYDDLFNVIGKTDGITNQLVKQKGDQMTKLYIIEARKEQRKKIPATVTTYEYDESNNVVRTIVDQYHAKRTLLYEYEFYPSPEPIEEELLLEEMEEE